jgi:hypothetical protein
MPDEGLVAKADCRLLQNAVGGVCRRRVAYNEAVPEWACI